LGRHGPDFTFRLIQLAEIAFDKIQGTDTGIMVLHTLKARQTRQLLSNEVCDEALLSRLREEIQNVSDGPRATDRSPLSVWGFTGSKFRVTEWAVQFHLEFCYAVVNHLI